MPWILWNANKFNRLYKGACIVHIPDDPGHPSRSIPKLKDRINKRRWIFTGVLAIKKTFGSKQFEAELKEVYGELRTKITAL